MFWEFLGLIFEEMNWWYLNGVGFVNEVFFYIGFGVLFFVGFLWFV